MEGCNGFLSMRYKCGICETSVCPDCHEKIDEENKHICSEEAIQSVLEIKKNTKRCPKCGVSIYKIEGCHQMWCHIINRFLIGILFEF